MLETRLRKFAAAVIGKADRLHPADAVLRNELKQQRVLTRSEAGQISAAVFGYYRWFQWLKGKSIDVALEDAVALDERFAAEPGSFSDDELVAKTVPQWVSKFVDVSPAWVRALQRRSDLWLRARKGAGEKLRETLRGCDVPFAALPEALRYRGQEDLFRTPEFQNGAFELQDISSQVVSLVCDPKPKQTWWDACAGEGGKTLHLSDLMENKGLIWATDKAEWRLKKLKQRAARAGVFNYRTALWDGGERLPTKTLFDGALIDAPCSGVGTWGRNPHARWTTTETDVQELAVIQGNLLKHASRLIKPGGKLVYSVCTLTRAETIDVAAAFDSNTQGFRRISVNNPIKNNGPTNDLWLLPQDAGGNGMYVCAWQRT